MVQAIPATEVTLRQIKQSFNLSKSSDTSFFTEWIKPATEFSQAERTLLDRVKANFLALMEDPPMLENTVKMVSY